jgi:hypothetical protein
MAVEASCPAMLAMLAMLVVNPPFREANGWELARY